MKDILNQELKIGDKVAVTYRCKMYVSNIIGFTESMVRVDSTLSKYSEMSVFKDKCLKINDMVESSPELFI